MTGLKRTRPIMLALGLFLLNVWICRELFTAEFLGNSDSNEAAFVSLSRFFREFGFFTRWFPWFNCGMPIENAYQPLLPMTAALVGKLSGWSVERAFHFVLAVFYCAGPVALFCFVRDWGKSLAAGMVAGLLYSVWSPAELMIPLLRVNFEGHWAPLRFYNLIHYAEDPHNVALAILPLALLFLRRAKFIPAVLCCAAVVLSNAFGAVDLAVGGLCIVIAHKRGFRFLALTGVTAYCLASPWLSPSLIALMRKDQWSAGGVYHSGPLYLLLFALIWCAAAWITRKIDPASRFGILFSLVMCTIPMAYFLANVTFVPQGNRYQLELELAVCALCGAGFSACPPRLRALLALPFVLFVALEVKHQRRYAKEILKPADVTQTTQYRTVEWLNAHASGERAMVSGDTEYLYNVLSNNPQMSGGHDPTAPNWYQRVGVYSIYVGAPKPEDATLWLQAFGARYLMVQARVYGDPHKFDKYLHERWREQGDAIFDVPRRGSSFAHVVPQAALVQRAPIHGLDLEPLRPYVAALNNDMLPQATWSGETIRARLRKDQVLSVQINYAPGWEASVAGRGVPVHADPIGLTVIEPQCEGDCEVHFHFGVTAEAWFCRALSLLAALVLIGWPLYEGRRRIAAALSPPAQHPEFAE